MGRPGLSAGAGEPQSTDPSGAPPGHQQSIRNAAPTVPAGMDDMLQPTGAAAPPAAARAHVSDAASSLLQTLARSPLWERLTGLAPSQRPNAVIGSNSARVPARPTGSWPRGSRRCGARPATTRPSPRYAPSKRPAGPARSASRGSRGPVRSHASAPPPRAAVRTSASAARASTGADLPLDFDAGTGNLFCVVRWGGTTGTASWTMNISTNGGATWAETYDWSSSVGVTDVSAVVVADFVNVRLHVQHDRRTNSACGAAASPTAPRTRVTRSRCES